MASFDPLQTFAQQVCSPVMFKTWGRFPRALVAAVLIAAGPVVTFFIARQHQAPEWVAGATGMLLSMVGISILGRLVNQAFQNRSE